LEENELDLHLMIIQQKQQADILDFSCNGKIKYGVYAYFLHSFRKINEVKQIPKKPHPLYEQNFPKKKKNQRERNHPTNRIFKSYPARNSGASNLKGCETRELLPVSFEVKPSTGFL
jgi:hypothetical protein